MANELGNADAVPDTKLVRRCLDGDQTAWTQLIERYQRLIYSVARVWCQDADELSDIFQATCLDLYRGLPEVRDAQALPAWLITVARRRAIASMKTRVPIAEAVEGTEEFVDQVQAIEREHALERAILQLPERCRELVNLLYFNVNQPSYVEISEKLGMPVASIGPTRARCLDKLRKLLS